MPSALTYSIGGLLLFIYLLFFVSWRGIAANI